VANNVPWSPSVDPILVIIWHLLADPDIRYKDLGADHYTRHVDLDAKRRNHIR
jgi:transposase